MFALGSKGLRKSWYELCVYQGAYSVHYPGVLSSHCCADEVPRASPHLYLVLDGSMQLRFLRLSISLPMLDPTRRTVTVLHVSLYCTQDVD
jgi:hypothetical protein